MAEEQTTATYDPVVFCHCLDKTAKWWWSASMICKLLGFLFGAVTILLALPSKPVPYVVAIFTLLSEGSTYRSDWIKGLAQSLRRKIDYRDGLDWAIGGAEYSDLIMRSPTSVKRKSCNKQPDEPYFASDDPPGPRRALKNVSESAWWSKHLAEKMWQYCLAVTVLAAVSSIGLLIWAAEGAHSHELGSAISRVVTSVLMLVLSLGLIRLTIGYYSFATKAEKAEQKAIDLLKSAAPSVIDAVKVINDYHFPRASAPVLPEWVWKWNRNELNRIWQEHRN